MNITIGKKTEILLLKKNVINSFVEHVSYIKSTRRALYRGKLERVMRCPVCAASTKNSLFKMAVYGGKYHECLNCSHHFIIDRPARRALEQFYSTDKRYASTYTDAKTNENRVRQVAMPKARWMIKQFKSLYGRYPKFVLDVGAGGGHFVYACRNLGIKAEGLEVSEPSIDFCKKSFGIELKAMDFITNWRNFADADIVTFWGVIEHSTTPTALLAAAHKVLSRRNGLVVVNVPRWDSFSTTIQSIFSKSIVRHLDPLGHINCFTDKSISKAFEICGFAQNSAWYFGMDAYELLTQLSYNLREKYIMHKLGTHVDELQNCIDKQKLSDEIVLTGRPV